MTAAQVNDVHDGDLITVTNLVLGDAITGRVRASDRGALMIGPSILRWPDGTSGGWTSNYRLEVVERAKPPLPPFYVNHTRTEPVNGDVCTTDVDDVRDTWHYLGRIWWRSDDHLNKPPSVPLRLLVDGEIGWVVL